jgi:amidase
MRPGVDRLSRREVLAAVGIAGMPQAAAAPAVSDSEIVFASAAELARGIRAKKYSSEEVVKAYLKRIETVNPTLNAVVLLLADSALAQARKADQAAAGGATLGPLHGVPMTVKDSIDTEGVITTGGTKGYVKRRPEADAVAVARLKAAGAILLGKTNLPEMAMACETDNPVFGRANNPYDLNCSTAGSSGGEAAIIAAGGSPIGIGSDAGGSVRLPAHFCGIAGLRQSNGRVPISGHVPVGGMGMAMDFAVLGLMSRFVEDIVLALPLISGPDAWDPTVFPMPWKDPANVKLRGLRVAFYTDNGIQSADAHTTRTGRDTATAFAEAGMKVEEKRPELISRVREVFFGLFGPDGGAAFRKFLEGIGSAEIHPMTQQTIEAMKKYAQPSLEGVVGMAQLRFGLRATMLNFMQNYDLLLSPVAATAATPHGRFQATIPESISYTCLHNLTGWPAISVRAGTSRDGLPVGVQIAAAPWREDVVLHAAQYVETVMGGWAKPGLVA